MTLQEWVYKLPPIHSARKELGSMQATIARQAERIAGLEQEAKDGNRAYESLDEQRNRRGDELHALQFELSERAALIEKCEAVMQAMVDRPRSHEATRLAVQTLAAIAAQKGGA